MIAFLLPYLLPMLPFMAKVRSCKPCQAVLVGLLAFGAIVGFIVHERRQAVAVYVAAQEKLTAAESARRQAVIAKAEGEAEASLAQAVASEKRNASLKSEVARLSARNDKRVCHDADSMRRIRQAGQPPGR
jgi:hypothetical protein